MAHKGDTGSQPLEPKSTQSTQKQTSEDVPDRLTCKLCNKTFTSKRDKLIECERCLKWVCFTCSGLSKDEYKISTRDDSKMHWYCLECNAPAVAAVKTDNLIEEKCKQYFDAMKAELATCIQESVDPIKEDLATFKATQETKNTQFERAIQEKNTQSISESVKEMQEREDRKHNIIFFNIPESQEAEPENRKADDKRMVNELCESLAVDMSFSNPIRLGKKADKPRPVRITADSTTQVSAMVSAARRIPNLPDETLNKIVAKKDLTPLEREEQKHLLDLKRQKIEESQTKGEEAKWVIRNGKVINIARRTQNQEVRNAENN